ncbi:lysophospholipase L1-like esterase [Paenibacillus phyllosphaerae]|uniref:Lysophospholipase L1-like esterase n=1 Tax=Paenibacillus phyllosphaerae TaxID=274593 RepID=A0A7W5AUD0_9BACL|nr:SGNH/GDSL hydrolase family protein [Paenibacillus phyllosphaerae]MBB3108782.1 lysophospholipase L1-like esterase [Paenibacillus phyllosphaerae]
MFPHHATVLFQGDSITDGNRGRDGDPNHDMGHGYAFAIASLVGDQYPERRIQFLNRGNSGDRVVDLYARWREDALNLQPDVISILVGVNDLHREFANGSGVPADRYERVYRMLIEESKAALPDVTIVLCEPFILPVGQVSANWDAWHSGIRERQQLVQQLAEQTGSIFVRLQASFDAAAELAPPEYWLWDGFHPTPAGHGLLAREWMKQVAEAIARTE